MSARVRSPSRQSAARTVRDRCDAAHKKELDAVPRERCEDALDVE